MADLPEIPDYDIQAPLGQGGMAIVFRAQHLRLRRLVALKIMHADLAARDEQFSARFLREARIAADLTHPNIVQVYDVNKHDEMHYIAMEFVNGGLLEERIKSYMDFDELISILSDVAKGLDFAHKKGYIHRDIKPANILFRESGEAVISDFGIAKALDTDTQMTELGSVVGTPSYMSPEQASGGTVDSRCDLYSLAVMAYRILTGRTPYSGETSLSIAVQHITEPIPQMPDALQAVQPFLDKGMAKNPEDRYATGAELVADLKRCLDKVPKEDVSEAKTEVLTMLAESAEMEKAMAAATAAASGAGTSSKAKARPATKTGAKAVDVETTGSNTTISINMPGGSSRGIAIGAAALAVILALGFLLWPKGISQADQARVELLLSSAKGDINAGRYYQPEDNNAIEKFQKAKEIAPDYEPTQRAIAELAELLLQYSEQAVQNGDWGPAQTLAEKALSISPNNDRGQTQLAKIAEARRQEQLAMEELMGTARETAKAGEWQKAAEQFSALPDDLIGSEKVQEELAGYVQGFVLAIETSTEMKQFEDADAMLANAKPIAALMQDEEWKGRLQQAEEANNEAKAEIEREERVASLLEEADASKDSHEALNLYREAASLAPNNTEAREGVQRNANGVLSRAESAINSGNVSSAQRYIASLDKASRAGQLSGDQSGRLSTLRRNLSAAQSSSAAVDGLVNRFDRYMAGGKVTSAMKIFRRILETNPYDRRVAGLRNRLASAYVDLANREIAAGDWNDAYTYASTGLEAQPNSSQLKSIMSEAEKKRKPNFFESILGR